MNSKLTIEDALKIYKTLENTFHDTSNNNIELLFQILIKEDMLSYISSLLF